MMSAFSPRNKTDSRGDSFDSTDDDENDDFNKTATSPRNRVVMHLPPPTRSKSAMFSRSSVRATAGGGGESPRLRSAAKFRPKSAAASTSNGLAASVAEKEVVIKKVYNSPVCGDSRHGERVVARFDDDGFFYRAIIVSCPEPLVVVVEFDQAPVKRARVPNEHVIPISGAVARPSIRLNDFVLVQTKNYATGCHCFVPGIVVSCPVYEPNQIKFYGIMLYTHRSVMAFRHQLIRISDHKYQAMVNYITDKSRTNGVRMMTHPPRPTRPFSAAPAGNIIGPQAEMNKRIEKMIAESPFNVSQLTTSTMVAERRLLRVAKSLNRKENGNGLLGEILADDKRVSVRDEPPVPYEEHFTFRPETNRPERIASPYLEPQPGAAAIIAPAKNSANMMTFSEFKLAKRNRTKSASGRRSASPFRAKSPMIADSARRSMIPGAARLRTFFPTSGEGGTSKAPEAPSNLQILALKELKRGSPALMKAGLRPGGTIRSTEQLGDTLLEAGHPGLAFFVYSKAGSKVKLDDLVDRQRGNKERLQLLKIGLDVDTMRHLGMSQTMLEHDVEIEEIVDIYLNLNKREECLDFLMSNVGADHSTLKDLQTKIFEIAFSLSKEKAEKLFNLKRFTKYDRVCVRKLCEGAGLYERAVENCDSVAEVRRLLKEHAAEMKQTWLRHYFLEKANEDFEQVVQILRQMLSNNNNEGRSKRVVFWLLENFYPQWDVGYVLAVLFPSDDQELEAAIELFRRVETMRKLNKHDVYLNTFYIQSACVAGKIVEAEVACKDRQCAYNGKAVADFLQRLRRPSLYRLLMFVCDRFNLVEALVRFLYENDQRQLVEAYVAVLNPGKLTDVIRYLRKLGLENHQSQDSIEDEIKHLKTLVADDKQNSLKKQ